MLRDACNSGGTKHDMRDDDRSLYLLDREFYISTSPSNDQKRRSVLGLIAHDEKKEALTDFCVRHREALKPGN